MAFDTLLFSSTLISTYTNSQSLRLIESSASATRTRNSSLLRTSPSAMYRIHALRTSKNGIPQTTPTKTHSSSFIGMILLRPVASPSLGRAFGEFGSRFCDVHVYKPV